jgi:hypothetical protein
MGDRPGYPTFGERQRSFESIGDPTMPFDDAPLPVTGGPAELPAARPGGDRGHTCPDRATCARLPDRSVSLEALSFAALAEATRRELRH